jgi:hypothetical protein
MYYFNGVRRANVNNTLEKTVTPIVTPFYILIHLVYGIWNLFKSISKQTGEV